MKKKNKTLLKLKKTQQTINKFIEQTIKNYKTMRTKIKSLWILTLIALLICSCNVTRTITTESRAYQKGDTAVHITTKTTETYNAEKNK